MEVSDLEASHNKDCTPNSQHRISRSQPRDRSKDALCAQPKFIAKNLNPASITQGNLAFVGAPVSLADGQIIQGNGRTIALKITYDEIEKSANKYKKWLKDHAAEFGFTPDDVDQFDQPVLVRSIDVDDESAIELGNVVDTSQAKMSKIDQAKAYIRNLSEKQLRIVGQLIRDSSGETIGAIIDDIGLDIIDQLKDLDRTEIVENSKLTSEGKDFLRSVLVGLVFDSEQYPDALHHYMNLPHTIKAGLERSFGYIIPLINQKGDVRQILAKAVEVAAQVTENDAITTAREYASSKDMFDSREYSEQEIALAQFLLDASTQKAIRNAFRYYDELLKGKENLFGKVAPKSQNESFNIVFMERARPNPEKEAEEIIHDTIVRAQRLQCLGNDNSQELAKLDNLLGSDGWKWNDKETKIIRLSDDLNVLRNNPTELTTEVKQTVLKEFYDWIDHNPLMDYDPGPVTFKNWIHYNYPGYEESHSEIWNNTRLNPELNRHKNLVILEHFRRDTMGSKDYDRFQQWLSENYPENEAQAKEIWDTKSYGHWRENPDPQTARFVYLGICKRLYIDQGKSEPILLKGPHGLLTNKDKDKLFIAPFSEMKGVDKEVSDMSAEEVFEEWHNYAPDDNNFKINWPDKVEPKPVGTAHSIDYASDKILREWDQKGKLNIYRHEFDAGKRPAVVKGKILIISNVAINGHGILN
jgi:hypothetical protein